ncbi:MAG TPA: GAP family protein [Solirubrobacterales bacterium]|nr:GAP family protein [Solirubrobacterales bacterium]
MSDPLQIFLLALLSMANPTLLAAVTVMLLMPSPRRLMLGYLFGAYITSIASGILILHALHGSAALETSEQGISPGQDFVIGALLLIVAAALGEGRGRDWRERRAARKAAKEEGKEKKDPLPMRMLGRGSARVAFAIGIVLSFPGGSYLLGLTHIDRLEASAAEGVVLVVAFCLVQLLLLELPLLGYFFAPQRTEAAVASFRGWLAENGRRNGARLAAVLGVLLIIRGVAFLL